MSVAEFSKALQKKATESAAIDAISTLRGMQGRLLANAMTVYTARERMLKKASILEKDSEAFRDLGEKQGRTRLVITHDSLLTLVRSMHPGSSIKDADIMKSYLDFISKKFPNLKSKHFELYTSTEKVTSTRGSISGMIADNANNDIIAFRGLNFSHANTLTHIDQYLRSIGAFAGISTVVSKKAISEKFERGHVYAQTTGRQLLSIGGVSEDNDILDQLVDLSLKLDKASSSLRNPIYSVLDAEITKDFSSSKIFMNVEFQAKFSSDGTGNQDTGKIAGGLQLISSMLKLLDNISYSGRGRLNSTPVVGNIKVAITNFENLLKKLDKQTEAMSKVLQGYVKDPGEYLANLRSSDSLKEYVGKSLVGTLSGKTLNPLKIAHKKPSVYKNKVNGIPSTNSAAAIQALKKASKEAKEVQKALNSKVSITRNIKYTNLTSLQALLDKHLQDVVSANMGNGNDKKLLNYRTGRLAASAKVTRLTESREGLISAFYTYMRNPYGTFSEGGKQQYPKSRDPKLLIGNSIKEIAATLVGSRLRAIVV